MSAIVEADEYTVSFADSNNDLRSTDKKRETGNIDIEVEETKDCRSGSLMEFEDNTEEDYSRKGSENLPETPS